MLLRQLMRLPVKVGFSLHLAGNDCLLLLFNTVFVFYCEKTMEN